MTGSEKIKEEGSVNMNKILAIAFVAFMALLIASAFVYAWPDKQTDCSACHGPSLGTYRITVTATPSKTVLAPWETYTVEIIIGENPSGGVYGTGYWIAHSDADGTTGTSTGVYGGSSSGNIVTDQTYKATMVAPSTPGTYYYKVFGVDGPKGSDGAVGWALYNIAVTALDIEPPTVTITYPEDGATLSTGTFTATWTATDNVGVEYSEVYLDGVYRGQTAGYSWDFTDLPDGDHTLMVKSFDAAGNWGSDTNTFSVSVPPPPAFSAELAGVGRKPGAILPGNSVTLKARVKNTGTLDVDFYVEFVIKNPTGDVVGMVNTTEAVEYVGNGPLRVSTSWLVPSDASAGTYTLEATLYYKAVGTPTYTTGNTLTSTFKVR